MYSVWRKFFTRARNIFCILPKNPSKTPLKQKAFPLSVEIPVPVLFIKIEGNMRVILNGEHAMNCNLALAWIERQAFVNCLRMNCALRHIGCNSIHVSDELHGNSASKSWRSQFMMRQHQFIHKNEQSKNRRKFILLLLLFLLVIWVWA